MTQGKIWLDGSLVDWDDAKIHVLTHGLHYATGVFEGVRCYKTVNGSAIGFTLWSLDTPSSSWKEQ
jgi:branched-chain amino acid aminotransferase